MEESEPELVRAAGAAFAGGVRETGACGGAFARGVPRVGEAFLTRVYTNFTNEHEFCFVAEEARGVGGF